MRALAVRICCACYTRDRSSFVATSRAPCLHGRQPSLTSTSPNAMSSHQASVAVSQRRQSSRRPNATIAACQRWIKSTPKRNCTAEDGSSRRSSLMIQWARRPSPSSSLASLQCSRPILRLRSRWQTPVALYSRARRDGRLEVSRATPQATPSGFILSTPTAQPQKRGRHSRPPSCATSSQDVLPTSLMCGCTPASFLPWTRSSRTRQSYETVRARRSPTATSPCPREPVAVRVLGWA